MSLLNRYVHAVRKHLPKAQRDDIAAEIRETLVSQLEEREAEAGRPLTGDEQAAVIKRFGHPLVVAGRYGSREYLIGPRIFPFYRFVLKVMAWIAVPITLFLTVAAAMAENWYTQVPLVLWILSNVALAAFGVVTLIFARLERRKDQFDLPQTWDPRELSPEPGSSEPPSRWEPVGSLLSVAFYFLWWIGVLPLGRLNQWLGGSPSGVDLASIWTGLNPVIVALMLASMAVDALRIARPAWVVLHEGVWLVIQLAASGVVYQLLRADALFVAASEPPTALVPLFNQLAFFGLIAVVVAAFINASLTVRRLYAMTAVRHTVRV